MLPVGINTKHVGARSVFVFVHGRVFSGQVITEVHFWPSEITACSGSESVLPGRGEAIACSSISGTRAFGFFVLNNNES